MKSPAQSRAILRALEQQHPGADTELRYSTPFELLVATILSAQTTDTGVNAATPALFARYPDARAMAEADAAELERLIHATGFFRQKARALTGMALPRQKWTVASDTLILHGCRICKPKPICDRCAVRAECDEFQGRGRAPRARPRRT